MEKHLKQLRKLEDLSRSPEDLRLAAESWKKDWQTLVSTILSARTRDEVTIPVSEKLFKKFPSIKKLSQAKLNEIEKIIMPVNFYKTKSKNVLACAKMLVKEHNRNVPHDIKKLLKLPGVGRKTANVFLAESGGDNIGVDTHVFYISRDLGWAKSKNPHKVEEELKKLFSKKYWRKINPVLVRFGKTYTRKKEKDKILEEIKKIK